MNNDANISTTIESKTTKPAPKKWWLAGIFSILLPGLGQLYNGQLIKGVFFYFLSPTLLLAASLLIMKSPSSLFLYVAALAYIAIHLYIIIDSAITAIKVGTNYQPRRYNVLLSYGFVVFLFILSPAISSSIKSYFVQAFKLPSGAMEPSLKIGDHVLVDKFSYDSHNPARGDIVVFKYPVDSSKVFIKRVVGVPGDVIEIRDKQLLINEEPVQENYVVHSDNNIFPKERIARDNFGPIKVPPNSYFTMGDNRDKSHDSRFWGFVGQNKIIGKVRIVYWSWDGQSKNVRWQRIGQPVL